MHAMWASLKENVNCVSRLTDVVSRLENSSRKTCHNTEQNSDKELSSQLENPFRQVLFRPKYPPPKTQFYELKIGDPSRNIIEMIFHRASMEPTKPSRKIQRVLRVKNSIEIHERFEKYRENVMSKAYKQQIRHPRSMVDGNELLLFYGTTMACCSKKLKQVSQLCRDPSCRVCRLIHSKFDMEFTRRNGIRLSASSEEMSDNMAAFQVKTKRAVIICRAIAGRIANSVDGVYEGCDSVGHEGLLSTLEYLIVKNPCAVLPCFVIVFT